MECLLKGKLIKAASTGIHLIDEPTFRALLGMGLGGLIGATYGVSDDMTYASPQEKQTRAIAQGLRGALLGGATSLIPDIMGVNLAPVYPDKIST